mgnify:CR=1 FL=1
MDLSKVIELACTNVSLTSTSLSRTETTPESVVPSIVNILEVLAIPSETSTVIFFVSALSSVFDKVIRPVELFIDTEL